jgi:hypothetical protein
MNDDITHGPEADDRPANVPAPPRVVLVRARPSASGQVFRWWLLISLLLALALGACVALGLQQGDLSSVHVVIDGQDLRNVSINGLTDGAGTLLLVGVVLLALLLLLLVPLFVALVLAVVAIVVVCAVGVPLAGVALALAAITSPLWMLGLLVWLAVRRRHVPSATMPA